MTDLLSSGWRANAVGSGSVRTVRRSGREYLEFPIVPLAEMVLSYPEHGTEEYLPAAHISETADLWDGVPLTYVHPENRNRTVRDPDAFMGDVVGAVHDPELLDGGSRLKVSGLIDVEKAADLGGEAARLVDLLRAGESVSVSAGYATMDDEVQAGSFDGDAYDLKQGPPVPDHVAVFPSDSAVMARCSPEDGCVAPRANAIQNGDSDTMSESASNGSGGTRPTNDDGEPLATREEFAALKAMVADLIAQKENAAGACSCGTGEHRENARRRANHAAVPGGMHRDYDDTGQSRQTEDVESYPAGGRKSWERRKVGLDEVPDEPEEYPGTGRSAYERRKRERQRANAGTDSSDDLPPPTGTRSSFEARRNARDAGEAKPWLDHEYPHSAKRKHEEREEQRRRQEELAEQIKRNEARAAREQRRQGSDGTL